MKNKLKQPNNCSNISNFILEKVFLVNSKLLFNFKNIFSYQNIGIFLENYKIKKLSDINQKIIEEMKCKQDYYLETIIRNKQNLINENKFFELENIKFSKNGELVCPKNFDIIDEYSFSVLSKLLNINDNGIKKELFYGFNYGKIILIPEMSHSLNINNNYLIYVFSLNEDNSTNLNYKSEIILSFKTNNERNDFLNSSKEKNIFDFCLKNHSILLDKYKCQMYLMNEYKTEQLANSNLYNNKEENIKNKYLKLSIKICLEYLNIYKNNQLPYKTKEEKGYYLINKNYFDEICSILLFQEIKKQVEFESVNDNNLIERIIKRIDKSLIKEFQEINQDIINKKLNLESLYKLNISLFNNSQELYYYKNCFLINENLFNLLKELDNNIILKSKKIQCVIDNKQLILFIDTKIINIGHLNEKNEIEIDYLIHSKESKNSFILTEIFKGFKIKGFNYIKDYLSIGQINFTINNFPSKAMIYKLIEEKNSDKSKYRNMIEISEKLKSLIFLSIFQIKNYNNNLNLVKTDEKVILINPSFLINNYKYDKLKSLIEGNNEIKKLIKELDIYNFSNDSLIFNEIITKLDKNILEEINAYTSHPYSLSYSFISNPDNLILPNNKKIKIYREFIMINEKCFNHFKINFGFSSNNLDIIYDYKSGDILSIFDSNQNTILFGNIDSKNDFFNIQYILEYKEKYILKNELLKIKSNGIENYIYENTAFINTHKNNDFISPIFSSTNIIGYCLKYNLNIYNYDDYNKYEKFLNCDIFRKVLALSSYYNSLWKQMSENYNYNLDKKYYLIKKDFVLKIKKEINYESIKNIIDKYSINESENNITKSLLLSIKNIPLQTINNYLNQNIVKKLYNKEELEPNIIPINNVNEPNNLYMIYDSFEIINEKILNLFTEYISDRDSNYLECHISEGKIIVHYPLNFNGNKKEVSVIGSLNNDNIFIKEYILFYEKNERYNHMIKIKGNIRNFLNGFQPDNNNTQPIVKNQYIIIGTIIKFGNNNNVIKDDINNNFFINNVDNYPISLSEYNLDYKVNSPLIRDNFAYPPLVGLENIGATCYMNATLQCFCHIEKFINFFKYHKQIVDIVKIDRNKLSSSFKLLIEKLWPNNFVQSNRKNYYAPEEFKNKISKMNPLFQGVAANDAKDLVNFIIMTLHEELNKINKNNKNINNNTFLDQRDPQLMFNIFASNFMAENKSIISDLFYGINCNITNCGGCNTQTFNYQTYFFIVFPLEEVRKFKFGNQFYNFNYNNNFVDIYDCFNYDNKINSMSGDNSMYCNYCKNTCRSSMCTILTTGPEILILLLNRGKGKEFNVKINFYDKLDLTKYIQYKNTGCKYKLIGVITHMGESGMSGHFIAYCLDPISKYWYKYNDAIVTLVTDFQNEIINYAMPYLLFYQKELS